VNAPPNTITSGSHRYIGVPEASATPIVLLSAAPPPTRTEDGLLVPPTSSRIVNFACQRVQYSELLSRAALETHCSPNAQRPSPIGCVNDNHVRGQYQPSTAAPIYYPAVVLELNLCDRGYGYAVGPHPGMKNQRFLCYTDTPEKRAKEKNRCVAEQCNPILKIFYWPVPQLIGQVQVRA
jgi:hypothetical protein